MTGLAHADFFALFNPLLPKGRIALATSGRIPFDKKYQSVVDPVLVLGLSPNHDLQIQVAQIVPGSRWTLGESWIMARVRVMEGHLIAVQAGTLITNYAPWMRMQYQGFFNFGRVGFTAQVGPEWRSREWQAGVNGAVGAVYPLVGRALFAQAEVRENLTFPAVGPRSVTDLFTGVGWATSDETLQVRATLVVGDLISIAPKFGMGLGLTVRLDLSGASSRRSGEAASGPSTALPRKSDSVLGTLVATVPGESPERF